MNRINNFFLFSENLEFTKENFNKFFPGKIVVRNIDEFKKIEDNSAKQNAIITDLVSYDKICECFHRNESNLVFMVFLDPEKQTHYKELIINYLPNV